MAEQNINFTEAKTKGLVAPNKIAEQEILKLAGGPKAFKPESWWNEQLTRQINAKDFKEVEGFREERPQFAGIGSNGGGIADMIGANQLLQFPGQTAAFSKEVTKTGFFGQPQTSTVTYTPVYKDVTTDVFNAIKSQSKQAIVNIQREAGEKKASSTRIARVTGGLLAGAKAPGMDNLSSGPMLGVEAGLGNEAMLGRRTRI